MAKLGIRQRYHIIVPVFRILFKEYPEMAAAVRGTLQRMVAHKHITEGARKAFLESVLIPLSPAISVKEVTRKKETRKVPVKK
ncbi:MAG: hypothetical protein AAB523_02360 [Patescibacteria group bacterium]